MAQAQRDVRRWRARGIGSWLIGLSALVAGAASVEAQPGWGGGGGMMGGMFESAFTSRDVEKYADFLGLDEEQKGMVGLLFEGYSTRTRQIGEEVRTRMREARDRAEGGGGPGGWDGMRESFEKVRADRVEAEKSFLADVKALLTEEQAEKWPDLERTMRRERTVSRGRMSGERADVIRIIDDLKPTPEVRAQIDPVLTQYAVDLDRELIARNEVYDDVMSQVGEMFRNGDPETAQAAMEKARAASTRLRDLNRRYAREVQTLLPDEQRQAFDAAFKRASFPQVYRESYAERSMTAAMGFADLSEDQQERLAGLQANYRRDANAVNDRLAAATEKSEEEFNIRQMFRREGGDDGPQRDLRQQKRDLDRTTLEALRKVLTPEQADRLPQRDEREDGGPRGGFQRQRERGGPPA